MVVLDSSQLMRGARLRWERERERETIPTARSHARIPADWSKRAFLCSARSVYANWHFCMATDALRPISFRGLPFAGANPRNCLRALLSKATVTAFAGMIEWRCV